MMKKACLNALLVILFATVSLVVVGCHGLGETPAERKQDISRQRRLENEMFQDDVDAYLHRDRTTRLSEHTVR